MAKRSQKRADAISAIRERLDGLVTGCLPADSETGTFRVYVMGGEVLAAHGPDDGTAVLRRLVNSGALSDSQRSKLTDAAKGGPVIDHVAGQVPDDLLYDTLHARFRQNILDFLDLSPDSFEEMDAVFVDNLQVGHDSRALLEELDALRHAVGPLRLAATELHVEPGTWVPAGPDEARLLDVCDPSITIADLLDRSPWEPYRTLELISGMMAAGTIVSRPRTGSDAAEDEISAKTDPNIAESTLDVWLEEVGAGGKGRKKKKKGAATEEKAPATGPLPTMGVETEKGSVSTPPPAVSWEGDTNVTGVDAPGPVPSELHFEETDDEPSDALRFHEEVKRASEQLGDEMDMFGDYDQTRGTGSDDGAFSGEVLDRVELINRPVEEDPTPTLDEIIEVGEAEDIDGTAPVSTVSLSFTGPDLEQTDIVKKLHVCNEVLGEVAQAMDRTKGPGAGRVCIQLLVDGTPHDYAALFAGIEVDPKGAVDVDRVMKNLAKRPQAEHRRIVNRGVRDLIERALSSTFEELGDEAVEEVMAHIAGYEKRLGF